MKEKQSSLKQNISNFKAFARQNNRYTVLSLIYMPISPFFMVSFPLFIAIRASALVKYVNYKSTNEFFSVCFREIKVQIKSKRCEVACRPGGKG